MLEKLQVLKTGKHKASNGNIVKVTTSDLEELASCYDPEMSSAPVCLGHDGEALAYKSDSEPAYGWIKGLQRVGDALYAIVKFTDNMVDLLKAGHYKNLSIAYYGRDDDSSPTPGKLYVKHLAMLGARPPAIKGLNNTLYFSEMPMATATDAEKLLNDNAKDWLDFILSDGDNGFKSEIVAYDPMPSKDNNWLFNEDGTEIAGTFLDDDDEAYNFTIKKTGDGWVIGYAPVNTEEDDEDTELSEAYKQMAEDEPDDSDELTFEPDAEPTAVTPAAAEPATSSPATPQVDELAELKAMLEEEKARNAELSRQLAEQRQAELADKATSYFSEGKLTNAVILQADLIKIFSELDKNSNKIAFSEDSDNVLNKLCSMLDKLPNIVQFGEHAKDVDKAPTYAYASPVGTAPNQEALDLHNKVLAYCAEKGLNKNNPNDYKTALKAVN